MTSISIADYAQDISLYEEFDKAPYAQEVPAETELLDALLAELAQPIGQLGIQDFKALEYSEKRQILDAAITISPADFLSFHGREKLNSLLQVELSRADVVDVEQLAKMPFFKIGQTKIVLWRGDITTLRVDAIVNAANSQLLGCFQPMHKCIDNAIHNRAGVQLRSDCAKVMDKQGSLEQTGTAKVTRAYNLPSKYVIHTVGPIVQSEATPKDSTLLASCYTSILDISLSINNLKSIALCAVSTGVFGYPIELATPIAVQTVIDWVKRNPGQLDTIIFNVFSERDHFVYQSLLEEIETG
jgi:O-acetyl-ADP-ribose deacetylase (regulator of RNase III)